MSQIAAEASCPARYGPNVDWMAGLDFDEYLVPVRRWGSIRRWPRGGVDARTQILSFFQVRAVPNWEYTRPYLDGDRNGGEGAAAATPTLLPSV